MYVITWLIVGLFTGMLATALVGEGYSSLFVDMAVGMVGAVLSGSLGELLRISSPLPAGPNAVVVAALGAAMLLFPLRAWRLRRRVARTLRLMPRAQR